MPYNGFRNFMQTLIETDNIDIINEFVSPDLEISEITDRYSKNKGRAILFTNTGTKFSVITNAMGSEERICLALNTNNLDDFAKDIKELFNTFNKPHSSFFEKIKLLPKLKKIGGMMPKVITKRGKCQEVVMSNLDINQLPILKTWPYDGGKFITLPVVHTKDPETGKRNVGMYRMQVFGPDTCGMHWHRHKGGAKHFEKYKKAGLKMPIAVILGGDPVYTYAATAPMPDNFDEYLLAGFMRKKPVKLVKCLTQDIEVPEDADFVIEGYVDPTEDFLLEGPFGDHTGFYSLADMYPVFHITAITHRKDAVYPATIVGIPPQEDEWMGKATERIFLAPMQLAITPEVTDMNMPVEGVFHNIVIVKIKKEYPGHASKVISSLLGAGQMMFSKILIVVDDEVDINNYVEIGKCISENVNITTDIQLGSGPMDVLDHAGDKPSIGGKMGIDATRKFSEEISHTIINEKRNEFNSEIFAKKLFKNFPEATAINTDLFKIGIRVIFIGVKKNKSGIIRKMHSEICSYKESEGIFSLVYIDDVADISDIRMLIWRAANNFDPKRDSIINQNDAANIIGIDSTRKSKEFDGFQRPWPNIVVMDENTIKTIDEKWSTFGLKEFYTSPSKKYMTQQYKGKAIAED
ncbi:MAG: menaquinone biosynthesis decarboxylase [Bacteroidetes bacterium]|nr:menaquinone biosynthesis decarboxylase [Bacteroidota bacterium]